MKCKWAFTQTQNHCISTGFNSLCNCDFAFSAEQLNGAHFPKIHANWIIRSIQFFRIPPRNGNIFSLVDCNQIGNAPLFFLNIFGFMMIHTFNANGIKGCAATLLAPSLRL